jgi:hypothetical protein
MARLKVVKQGVNESLVFTSQDNVKGSITYNGSTFSVSKPIVGLSLTTPAFTNPTLSGYVSITGTSGDARTIKAHAHSSTGEYANEFKGEFVNATGTMDGIASHYIMQTTGNTGTGVMRSILGVAYLPAGVAITGTSAAGSWISGGGFATEVATTATLNGTAVRATGMFAKVSSAVGSNMTACKQVSAGTFISSLLVAPSAGIPSIIHLAQEASGTQLAQAIYVEGANYCNAFITFDVAATNTCITANTTSTAAATPHFALKVIVGTTPYWIPLYSTTGTDGLAFA